MPAGAEGVEAWKRFARIVDGKLGDPVRGAKAWQRGARAPADRSRGARGAGAAGARARRLALLDDVLARRQQHADGDEAVAVRAGARAARRGAAAESRRRHRDPAAGARRAGAAQPRRRTRGCASSSATAGDIDGSLRIAERELFLTDDPEHKLAHRASRSRARWRDEAHDPRRAISAFERVHRARPDALEALPALAALYSSAGEWDALVDVDERRLRARRGAARQRRVDGACSSSWR